MRLCARPRGCWPWRRWTWWCSRRSPWIRYCENFTNLVKVGKLSFLDGTCEYWPQEPSFLFVGSPVPSKNLPKVLGIKQPSKCKTQHPADIHENIAFFVSGD